jgi:spore germination protein KB
LSNEKTISSRQYIWSLFILFASFAVIQIPGLMLTVADRDCWLAVIFAWALDVLLGILYAYMGWRFPDQNYIQHSLSLWGQFMGRIPGFFLLALFLVFCINTQYSLYLLVNKLVLPDLAPEIVLGIGFLLVAYIAKKGMFVIVHFCEAIGPFFFRAYSC